MLGAGCLDSPAGLEQSWPPPVAALGVLETTAGDADGDGLDELFVASVGLAADGAGIYQLRGGVDLDPEVDPIATGFSRVRRFELDAPADLQLLDLDGDSTRELVVLHDTAAGMRLTVLDAAELTSKASIALDDLGPQPMGVRGRIQLVPYATGATVFVLVGDQVRHIPAAELLAEATPSFIEVPPPRPGGWQGPVHVATFQDLGDSWVLVVAEPQVVWKAEALGDGATTTWRTIRDGVTWSAIASVDLVQGGPIELVGIAAAPIEVCGINLATEQQFTCAPISLPGVSEGLVFDVTTPPLRDLVVRTGSGALAVIANLRSEAGTLVIDGLIGPSPTGTAGVRVAAGEIDGVGSAELLLLAPDGGIGCRRVVNQMLTGCAP